MEGALVYIQSCQRELPARLSRFRDPVTKYGPCLASVTCARWDHSLQTEPLFSPDERAMSSDKSPEPKLSSTQHAIAGSLSGVTARFFIAPLDVIKIRLQVSYARLILTYPGHQILIRPRIGMNSFRVNRNQWEGRLQRVQVEPW